MAITLDELLGRNTQSVSRSSVENFPSYEEFNASRNQSYSAQQMQNNVRYNFDPIPAREVRSEESMRAYEASRPYVAPQNSEYQSRDYAFYNNLNSQRVQQQYPQPGYAPMPTRENVVMEPTQFQVPVQYPQPQQPQQQPMQTQQPQQSFYEFSAQDGERLSNEELFDKLSYTQANTPVFQEQESKQRTSIFARKAQKTQDTTEARQRGKLNAKGKVILAVYIAVIALVTSLIIVNATKINQGKAVTPTSSVEIVAEEQ